MKIRLGSLRGVIRNALLEANEPLHPALKDQIDKFPSDVQAWVMRHIEAQTDVPAWRVVDIARNFTYHTRQELPEKDINAYSTPSALIAAIAALPDDPEPVRKPKKEVLKQLKLRRQTITAYHTSPRPLSKAMLQRHKAMWFTLNIDHAKLYHMGTAWDKNKSGYHTYKIELTGKFMTKEQADAVEGALGLDFISDLTANPDDPGSQADVKAVVKATGCDGFFHTDYDPSDDSRDSLSLFVVDPASCIKSMEDISDTFTKDELRRSSLIFK